MRAEVRGRVERALDIVDGERGAIGERGRRHLIDGIVRERTDRDALLHAVGHCIVLPPLTLMT